MESGAGPPAAAGVPHPAPFAPARDGSRLHRADRNTIAGMSVRSERALHAGEAANAGIRRARGRFITAKASDTFFSSDVIARLAKRGLDPDTMYRVDRHDFSVDDPSIWDLDDDRAARQDRVAAVDAAGMDRADGSIGACASCTPMPAATSRFSTPATGTCCVAIRATRPCFPSTSIRWSCMPPPATASRNAAGRRPARCSSRSMAASTTRASCRSGRPGSAISIASWRTRSAPKQRIGRA